MAELFLKILVLLATVGVGVPLSYWIRRVDMPGLEIWLPAMVVFSYAWSPVAGVAVAVAILAISWFLFPYEPAGLVIMAICLGIVAYTTTFFTVTAENFIKIAMLLTVLYNGISNPVWMATGGNLFRISKFVVFSLWVSWLIYSQFGWKIIVWFS